MAERLKQMKGDEFVAKLLAGERDFRRIKLEEGFRVVNEKYSSVTTYFNENASDFRENPLNLIGADLSKGYFGSFNFSHVKAESARFEKSEFPCGVFTSADLENVNFSEARLVKANFTDANLLNAGFWNANLTSTYFVRTNLTNANFENAQLNEATFAYANVSRAGFRNANLCKADLQSVRNLDYAFNLSSAHFLETKVDRKDLPVLKQALKDRENFIYSPFFEHYFGGK